jgi:hypothetical protein
MNQDDKERRRNLTKKSAVMKTGGRGFGSRLGSEISSSDFFFFLYHLVVQLFIFHCGQK